MPVENTPPLSDALSGLSLYDTPAVEVEDTENVVSAIRDACASPTPLEVFLRDPVIKESLARRSRSRSKHRMREGESSSSSVMSAILLEQEREAQNLKAMMSSTSDRLEREMQRADQAEKRLEYVELLVKDAEGRAQAERAAKTLAEDEGKRWKEECDKWKAEIERVNKEHRRSREQEMRALEERRLEDAEEIEQLTSEVERLRSIISERQAIFEERERGWRGIRDDWIEIGRDEGWEAGYERGWIDGREQGLRQARRIYKQEQKQRDHDHFWDDSSR